MKLSNLLFLLLPFSIFAQKVDIDNTHCYISNAILPDNYIPAENRTYSFKLYGNPELTGMDVAEKIKLFGWKVTDTNPNLEIGVRIDAFGKGKANPTSRKEEQKDKDGKVTSSKTYYKVSCTDFGSGTITINGPKNSYSEFENRLKKEEKEKEKAEKNKGKEKKESKEDKAKKEIENNPFLQNVDLKVDEVVEENVLASKKELVYKIPISKEYSFSTGESITASAAQKEYNDKTYNAYNQHANDFKAQIPNLVSNEINFYYGYKPFQNLARFKRLDSDKHPEFTMFDNAIKGLKLIFGKMRYNLPITTIENDLKPIIEYFEKTASKLEKSEEKNDKKLRAACYYNLCQIHFFTDNHTKLEEIANKIILSKHDEDDGKDFIKKSQKVVKVLNFHNMKSRHILPIDGVTQDELGEKESEVRP